MEEMDDQWLASDAEGLERSDWSASGRAGCCWPTWLEVGAASGGGDKGLPKAASGDAVPSEVRDIFSLRVLRREDSCSR